MFTQVVVQPSENGGIALSPPGASSPIQLRPAGPLTFRGNEGEIVVFRQDSQGAIVGLTVSGSIWDPASWDRIGLLEDGPLHLALFFGRGDRGARASHDLAGGGDLRAPSSPPCPPTVRGRTTLVAVVRPRRGLAVPRPCRRARDGVALVQSPARRGSARDHRTRRRPRRRDSGGRRARAIRRAGVACRPAFRGATGASHVARAGIGRARASPVLLAAAALVAGRPPKPGGCYHNCSCCTVSVLAGIEHRRFLRSVTSQPTGTPRAGTRNHASTFGTRNI